MANVNQMHRKFQFAAWGFWLAIGACAQSYAATTDLATAPISTATDVVLPNVLFTLDDSGSMAFGALPDYAGAEAITFTGNKNHCKINETCSKGEVPYQTSEFNGLAYNPRLTYKLPVNADGSLMAAQVSPWTGVPVDGFGVQSAATTNMTNGYRETLYCNAGVCKKNGVDTNNPFLLRATIADNPPVYAFPGNLPVATGGVASTPYNGVLNQTSAVPTTIYNGTLNAPNPGFTNVVLANVVSVTHSGATVTVNYNTPTAPPLATGDTVVVSGGSCSSGYRSGGNSRPITVVNATRFTYVSNNGNTWTNTSCTFTLTKLPTAGVPPSVIKSGNTVTVTLAAAPVPALATGNLVTVANSSGTCDPGYRATSATMTRISNTQFTYSVSTAVTTLTDTSCNITQVNMANPASPGIRLSGSTVTVYLTAHGLLTNDLVQVSNGTAGTCDSGFRTSGAVAVTRVDANTFTYSPAVGAVTTSSNCRIDRMNGAVVAFTTATNVNANPYYFVIIPTEYCDSMYLTDCIAATAPIGAYTYPAPTRFCRNAATAALAPGAAGAQGAANCRAKMSFGTVDFQYVRYGLFWRGDIVPARTNYGNETYTGTVNADGQTLNYVGFPVIDRSKRSDCLAPPNCTYPEEMTNFSNWYAYYQTRMQMMKSSAGRAFATLNDRYRVGFVTIHESAWNYLAMGKFDAAQKIAWYDTFYDVNPSGGTPLREALSHAGRYFAGKKPGVFTDDPMEYACQQNFELLTTDGYWNGTSSDVKELDGATTMRNYDNVNSGFSKRSDGAFDGALAGATNTLADVAMYYYKTDLRNPAIIPNNCTGALGADVCEDIVPRTAKDYAAGLSKTQHMTTYSLGLVDGLMTYQSNYETASTGDFSNIKTAAIGCGFSGGGTNTCNWPLPASDAQSALDDLWHAAVNGRGMYYNARDPDSLAAGLSAALEGINVHTGAAAASATSSPVITLTDRTIFSSTYRTTTWDGQVSANLLDPLTGEVTSTVVWTAQGQLDALSPRFIYTYDSANVSGNHLKDFLYSSLTSTEKTYFDNKCTFISLSQCTAAVLTPAEIASGNDGSNLVQYLRGNRALETPPVYRVREHLLGDTVNAKPTYVKVPQLDFIDAVSPNYTAFKSAQLTRQGVLYMGSNDGMLHAFNTDTGAEMWGYVPKIVMPELYRLADKDYAIKHHYFVDGSPATMDIYVDSTVYPSSGLATGWHTILVGGLGFGGRGFYALDVTNPVSPVALWEFCSNSALCDNYDVDMGYSFGNPVITKRSTDGKWVVLVTSGYNNVSPGSGKGTLFVLDAVTGTLLHKVATGAATDPPSGLAKLSPWLDNAETDMTTRYAYGADLNGDLWRFDLGAVSVPGAPTVTRIATLVDDLDVAQSVTTRVELGDAMNNVSNSLTGTGNPIIYVGTGRYLGNTDKADPVNSQIQSIYAIKDDLSKTGIAAYVGNPRSPNAGFGSFVRQYIHQAASNTARTVSANSVSWASNSGWYVDLVATDASNDPIVPSLSPGERVRLDPLLLSGTLVVVSAVPSGTACAIGGTSWLYSFNYLNGKSITTYDAGMLLDEGVEGATIMEVGGATKLDLTGTTGSHTPADVETNSSALTEQSSWRELIQ